MPEESAQTRMNPPPVILQPLPPEEHPSIDHIETEDGAPVDNVFSEKQMRLLTEPLYSCWNPGHPFVALANVGLFYGIDLPPLVPDALLSLHVRLPENLFPKIHRSYFVWKYGKRPEVVIEVVSNRKGGEDTEKLLRYADVGIANYFIYDPEHHLSDQPLRQFKLETTRLLPVDLADERCLMPEIGLGLRLWEGRFESTDATWLRWTDSQGVPIPTGRELATHQTQRAELEARRAEQEARRAEQEARRAEQEARRADEQTAANARLVEQLRKLGIEPDVDDSKT